MPEEIEQSAENERQHNPRKTRRQLWVVFGFLLLAATGLTAHRWYHANYVAAKNDIPWQKIKWKDAKAELKQGRKMLLIVLDSPSITNEFFLGKFETGEIRKQVYLSSRLPVKLTVTPDSDIWGELKDETKIDIDLLPCAIVTKGNESPIILAPDSSSEEIMNALD